MGKKSIKFSLPGVISWLSVIVTFVVFLGMPVYFSVDLWYWETKGPFKNWTQVVDLNGDGKLDVLISHTRWEEVDISWAGIGRWINQGNGQFKLIQDQQMETFAGNAGAAADIDQDGDVDVLVQDFGIRLLRNQGGQQEGTAGAFKASTLVSPSSIQVNGHPDMGGKITMGDLNGDNKVDALVTGCCYGAKQTLPSSDHEPSISWVWINDSKENGSQTRHVLSMDFLNGIPIREAALGDVDGDGDLDVFAAVGKPTLGKTDSLNDLLLLNDGTGQLTISQKLANTDSTSVALGDINGDARLDVLVGTTNGARLWLNSGSSTPFFTPSGQAPGRAPIKSVFLADLDSDGDSDALLAGMRSAILWWNNGRGEFSNSGIRFSYKEDSGLAVEDFDGDGDADIFAGNNDDYYRIWFNDGTGHFKPAR